MKYSASTLFLGNLISQKEEPTCIFHSKDDVLCADCSNNTNLSSVPQNLNPKLKSLDLSHNNLINLTQECLSIYEHLEKLTMENITVTGQHGEFLKPLKKLTHLSLASANIPHLETIELPPNLTFLNLSNTGLTNFYFKTVLPNLKSLILSHNNISRFPSLAIKNTLQHVNLDNNVNLTILVEDIVPYCYLHHLEANPLYGTNAYTKEDYCNCERLAEWLHKQNIFNNIDECELRSIRPGISCDQSIEPSLLDQYQICMNNQTDLREKTIYEYKTKRAWLIYGAICSVLLVGTILTIVYVLHRGGSYFAQKTLKQSYLNQPVSEKEKTDSEYDTSNETENELENENENDPDDEKEDKFMKMEDAAIVIEKEETIDTESSVEKESNMNETENNIEKESEINNEEENFEKKREADGEEHYHVGEEGEEEKEY